MTIESLMARVDQREPDECWPWTGPTNKGYGYASVDGRSRAAYRAIYEAVIGPVPAGLELDHACHTRDITCPGGNDCPHRRCVNPAHLEAVTHRENILRGRGPAATYATRTHCLRGHEYSSENTRFERNGSRSCRNCERDRERVRLAPTRVGPKPPVAECVNGHPFTAENTYTPPGTNRRQCRACKNQRKRAARVGREVTHVG